MASRLPCGALQAMHGCLRLFIGCLQSQALTQGIAHRQLAPFFLEQFSESFICKFREASARVQRKLLQRMPNLIIEFDTATDGHAVPRNRTRALLLREKVSGDVKWQ